MARKPPHLLISLSPHGFGHVAMTAPVIAELRRLRPDLHITLRATTPSSWLRDRIVPPYDLIAETDDFGMAMKSALQTDGPTSHRRYVALHARLEEAVEREARQMQHLGVDAVLSNVSYISLLAARLAGIPALAFCCLNWHGIYGAYCRDMPGAERILSQMREAYSSARAFLTPVPCMEMDFPNQRTIGLVARRGTPCRGKVLRRFGLDDQSGQGVRIGVIAFGGMDLPLDYARWPRLPGWKWVVCGDPAGHPDMVPWLDDGEMNFSDMLSSMDVIIGKPGYGTFGEAAANGIPMLFTPRDPQWPESAPLVSWLTQHGRALEAPLEDLFDGVSLHNQLQALFSLPDKPLVPTTGIGQAASAVLDLLPC